MSKTRLFTVPICPKHDCLRYLFVQNTAAYGTCLSKTWLFMVPLCPKHGCLRYLFAHTYTCNYPVSLIISETSSFCAIKRVIKIATRDLDYNVKLCFNCGLNQSVGEPEPLHLGLFVIFLVATFGILIYIVIYYLLVEFCKKKKKNTG